jgi:acylphosphatase
MTAPADRSASPSANPPPNRIPEERARLRIIVTGRVQGVFYRAAAADQARTLGLHGWARNLSDGTVEIVAEGRRDGLALFARWTRSGPPRAQVAEVIEEWDEFVGEFGEFRVS